MSEHSRKRRERSGRGLVAWVWMTTAGLTIAILLIAASRAEAGTYRVALCHPALGAGAGELAFERTSAHYRGQAGCADGEGGLEVLHRGRSTRAGRWGAWTLHAPVETRISYLRALVSGKASRGHRPELRIGGSQRTSRPFGNAGGPPHPIRWEGEDARTLSAGLRCSRPRRCGAGRTAMLRLRRLMLRLEDSTRPTLSASGELFAGGLRRGTDRVAVAAHDLGSGVRRVLLEVNGEPVAVRAPGCAENGEIATRLAPCPGRLTARLRARTGAAPFRQGPNRVRVCALDFASDTAANRACLAKRVRVDNRCPIAGEPVAGARIRARLVGPAAHGAVPHGRSVRIVGRLAGPGGTPIAGERACVATRTALAGVTEQVVATPRSDGAGRFEAALPAGPSREVRATFWRDGQRSVSRYLKLRVAARPRLSVEPRGVLRNGDRARFAVALHGPEAGGREVQLQVRSGGRWLRLRDGETDNAGTYRARYRFRATTGKRTYRFRAFVPRQPGYPYARGSSQVRRVEVSG